MNPNVFDVVNPIRKAEVDGHGESWLGWFHGWTRTETGQLRAVIEGDDGELRYVEPYRIRFLVRP